VRTGSSQPAVWMRKNEALKRRSDTCRISVNEGIREGISLTPDATMAGTQSPMEARVLASVDFLYAS
jgi:hypothetical protein